MQAAFYEQVFLWIMIIYGITQIVTEAQIFAWLRNSLAGSKLGLMRWLGNLVSCFLCTSVWVSFLLGLFVFSPTTVFWSISPVQNAMLDSMFGSAFVWFLYVLESKLSR